MKKRHITLIGATAAATAAAVIASLVLLKPRPTRLAATTRAGDDTLVVNQRKRTQLRSIVLDQYGRRFDADAAVRYRWTSGDSIALTPNGILECDRHGDAVIRATLGSLVKEFTLRCRPVASIEAPTWVDLIVGDSTRDLPFVARGPDGRIVTELRGTVSLSNGSIVGVEGTTVRPKRSGVAFVNVDVGDREVAIPIAVYQLVTSFVGEKFTRGGLMAMRVSLARGDTMYVPLPKSAFWVTYLPQDRGAAPPTIELRGDGSCTTGNGLRQRRIEDDEYAKYCFAGSGARLMIAHGVTGAATVRGAVAIKVEW